MMRLERFTSALDLSLCWSPRKLVESHFCFLFSSDHIKAEKRGQGGWGWAVISRQHTCTPAYRNLSPPPLPLSLFLPLSLSPSLSLSLSPSLSLPPSLSLRLSLSLSLSLSSFTHLSRPLLASLLSISSFSFLIPQKKKPQPYPTTSYIILLFKRALPRLKIDFLQSYEAICVSNPRFRLN